MATSRIKVAAYVSPEQAAKLEVLRVALDMSMSSLLGLIVTMGLPRVLAITELPVQEQVRRITEQGVLAEQA